MTLQGRRNRAAAVSDRDSQTDVRMDDAPARRPGREAPPGGGNRWGRKRRGEQLMVEPTRFRSYYGRPILKKPTWSAQDIAGYLFLGGLAGASSAMAAAAELTGRSELARGAKIGAAVAIGGSLAALVNDLGRPARFLNMLRVFKVTSPMSVGSWLLAGYAPLAGVAAASAASGRLPWLGRAATLAAGVVGPAVATYTAPLIANTAVPVWHDAHRELPFVFVSSAAAAASGLGMLTAPTREAGPARQLAVAAAVAEFVAVKQIHRRLGETAEPLRTGRAGRLMMAAQCLTAAGALTGQIGGRRSRAAAMVSGLALLAGSACTRFGIFYAGVESAADPRYTVGPQRDRLSRDHYAERVMSDSDERSAAGR